MKNILLISVLSSTLLTNSLTAYAEADKEQTAEQTDTVNKEETDKAITQRVMPNAHANKQREITHLLTGTSTQVVRLNALEQEFEMYFLTAIEKEPIGSVLFFPDERNHSDWPVTLNPLRVGLTEHNWQTAVLTLPATKLEEIPERSTYQATAQPQDTDATQSTETENTDTDSSTDSAANSENPSNTETSLEPKEESPPQSQDDTPAKTMAEITMARALATHKYLKETSPGIVIIGIGQGATWASAYASTLGETDKEMSRLILINPQQSLDVSAPALNPLIESIKIDTFDVYTPNTKNADKKTSTAIQRKRAANLSEIEAYRQIKAPASAWGKSGNDWLYRKVKGLIKNNIRKEFKDKATEQSLPIPPEKTNQKPGSSSTS
jgi:hypothetical protein